jgi:ATP-dependent Zn protease
MNKTNLKLHMRFCLWFALVGSSFMMDVYAQEKVTNATNSISENSFNRMFDVPTQMALVAIIAYALGYSSHVGNSTQPIVANTADPVLTFDQRLKLLQKELHESGIKPINVSIIASLTQGLSRSRLKAFIDVLQKNKVDAENMAYVQKIIDEMHLGVPASLQSDVQTRYNFAIHEAGHAIILLLTSQTTILDHISMVRYKSVSGFNFAVYQDGSKAFTMQDRKNYIKYLLSGGIAEQVFGLEQDWQSDFISKKIRKWFTTPTVKNEYISDGLFDLLGRPSVALDVAYINTLVHHIVLHDMDLILEDNAVIDEQIYTIIEECYQEALQLMQAHTTDVEKIVQLLMQKNVVLGDEIYAALGKVRPLYACEIAEQVKLQQQDETSFKDIDF